MKVIEKNPDTGEVRLGITISNNFSVNSVPNGGFLGALAVSAAWQSSPHRDILSFSAQYIEACKGGESAEIVAVPVGKIEKNKSVISVVLKQVDPKKQELTVRTVFLIALGGVPSSKIDMSHTDDVDLPPELSSPDNSEGRLLIFDGMDAFNKIINNININSKHGNPIEQYSNFSRYDLKISKRRAFGVGTGSLKYEGWWRFSDGRKPCQRSLLYVLDAMPPPILGLHASPWIPTIEYTAHCFAHPSKDASNWLQVRNQVTVCLQNGLHETDGTIWDSTGRLLARSRQLARVWRPIAKL